MIQHGIGFDYPTSGKSLGFLSKFRTGSLAHWFVRWEALRAARAVECIVCVDYVYPTWLKTNFYNPSCRILTIPNFTRIAPNNIIPTRKIYSKVLFARRMVERRGARIMADATKIILEKYPTIEVTFAGVGPLKDIICETFFDEPRVRCLEYDPRDTLDIHLRHDIAIVPSLASEGTSLSLLEAMATKCAVVATPVGGVANILIDQHNGLICEASAESIAEAIGRLHEDMSLASRLASCGYDTVEQGFSYSRWSKSWARVFSEELNSNIH